VCVVFFLGKYSTQLTEPCREGKSFLDYVSDPQRIANFINSSATYAEGTATPSSCHVAWLPLFNTIAPAKNQKCKWVSKKHLYINAPLN